MPRKNFWQRRNSTAQANISFVQASSAITSASAGAAWSPANTSLTGVAAGNLLVALGAWWDSVANTGGTQGVPADSNGTWSKSGAACPTLPTGPTPVPGWPVAPAMYHQLSAAAGSHTITPHDIYTGGGDGIFMAAEFHGTGAWSLVDSGYAFNGSGTAGAVDGVTVTTNGTAAQVGDLCVVATQVDGDPTAFGLGSPTTGSWNNLLTDTTSSLRATGGFAWRIVTVAGAQSATWAFNDAACEVNNAVIGIFRCS